MKQITSLSGFTHFQIKLLIDALLVTVKQYICSICAATYAIQFSAAAAVFSRAFLTESVMCDVIKISIKKGRLRGK